MTEGKQIAVVTAETGYDGLHRAFRARADDLRLTRLQIDVISNLTGGHAAKLLAPYPIKAIGRTTLGPLLHALRLKLVLMPDESIPVVAGASRVKRSRKDAMLNSVEHALGNMPETRAIERKIVREILRKHARRAGLKSALARATKLTPSQRRRIARTASRARWKRAKQRARPPKPEACHNPVNTDAEKPQGKMCLSRSNFINPPQRCVEPSTQICAQSTPPAAPTGARTSKERKRDAAALNTVRAHD